MLLLNKFLLFTGNILIAFYIIIAMINNQWGTIPQALIIAVIYTLILLYWRSTVLMDIEDEKERQKELKKKEKNKE